MNKVYDDPAQWYHPEIDYYEMLEKLRWTKDPMMERDIGLQDIWGYTFPLNHIDMFHFVIENNLPENYPSFQWWNKQFNDALSKLLIELKPRLILEVGAGDGTLSSILAKRGFNIHATDSFHWKWKKSYFNVEELSYTKALTRYKPDVVICSWMPLGTNWTINFRKAKSVQHYITIGEVEAACGGEWEKRKGWIIKEVDECTKFALSRTDNLDFESNNLKYMFGLHHSQVHLFSREGGAIHR